MAGPAGLVQDVERDVPDLSAERVDEGDQTTDVQVESAAPETLRAGFDIALRCRAPDDRSAVGELDRIPTQPVDRRVSVLTAVLSAIGFIGLSVDDNIARPVTGLEPPGAIDRPARRPRSGIQGHERSPLVLREPNRRPWTNPAGPAGDEKDARPVDEIDGPWSEPPARRRDTHHAAGHDRTIGVSPTDEGARPNAIGNA